MNVSSRLSLDDFKKWIKENSAQEPTPIVKPKNPLIGIQVESKIAAKRLACKIEEPSDDVVKLSEDFFRNGGMIVESEDKRFCIKVNSGTFFIHRAYVSRA